MVIIEILTKKERLRIKALLMKKYSVVSKFKDDLLYENIVRFHALILRSSVKSIDKPFIHC